MSTSKNSMYYVHVVIVIALMFLFRYIPAPAPITPYGMHVLGIFIGLVYGWSLCGLAWPSVLALVALGISDYGITETVFASVWGQAGLILMLFGFMLFAPLSESGLTEALGYKLLSIKFIQGRPLLMLAVIFVGVFLLTLTHINAYLLMFFMMTIFIDIFKKIGYQKGDRFIPMFLCGVFMQTALGNLIFPFYAFPILVYNAAGVPANNTGYLLTAIVFIVAVEIVLVMLFKILRLNLEPLKNINYEELSEKASQPLNKRQKGLLVIVFLFLASMLTVGLYASATGNALQQLLNKVGVYGAIATVLVIALVVKVDDEPLLTIDTLTKGVNWNILLLYSMALAMSNILTSADTGISSFVVGIASPILSTVSEYWFLLLLGLMTLILTNIGNNVVVIFTMAAVVRMLVGAGLAVNGPLAVMVVLFSGMSTGYLLPSASVAASLVFGSDMNTPKTALLQGVVVIVTWMLLLAFVMVPVGMFFL